MNFLELCQFTHRYISGGNEPPGTAPMDVTNQQGQLFSLVRSVQDAYLDVLNDQSAWTFMQSTGAITIPAGSRVITKATIQRTLSNYGTLITLIGDGLRYILCGTPTVSPVAGRTDSSQIPVAYIPYQQWRGFKDRPPIRTGKPSYFSVAPDESIVLDAQTSAPLSLYFDYRIKAPKLTANTDTPIFADEYHACVGWRAVRYWALTQESPTKFTTATQEYEKILNEMRSRYLPEIVFSVGDFSGQSALTS